MEMSTFSEEQIAYTLRQAGGGTPVFDVCRQPIVSERRLTFVRRNAASSGERDARDQAAAR
jgi:hypothetical protein